MSKESQGRRAYKPGTEVSGIMIVADSGFMPFEAGLVRSVLLEHTTGMVKLTVRLATMEQLTTSSVHVLLTDFGWTGFATAYPGDHGVTLGTVGSATGAGAVRSFLEHLAGIGVRVLESLERIDVDEDGGGATGNGTEAGTT